MHKGIRISAAAAGLTMLIGASGVPTAEAADRLSERASAQLPASISGLRLAEPVTMQVDRSVIDPALVNGDGPQQVLVRLRSPSVAKHLKQSKGNGSAHKQRLISEQSAFVKRAGKMAPGAKKLAGAQVVLNAVVMEVDAAAIEELAKDPDVYRISRVKDYELDLSETVPYIGADSPPALDFDGSGVSVAVLDSGIDYTHADLGGSGAVADYIAAHGGNPFAVENTVLDGQFPNSRVVGGYDFVGELWPAFPDLAPDPDPIDFEGHGTHVADIIGGNLGVAPGVDLYAVKVCSAISSSCSGIALIQGMEFSVDPDRDGDPSDAVDVINMSLGAGYGQPFDDDLSQAVENASALGVLTVSSAGNCGDQPYCTGTPSSAPSALSVAQTQVPSAALQLITVDGVGDIPAVFQSWSVPLAGTISGAVQYADGAGGNLNGCAPFAPGSLSGLIVLVDRGACNFTLKISNISQAGGAAGIIGLVAPGAPFSGGDGGDRPIDIPGYMINQADSNAIKGALPTNGTIDPANQLSLQGQMVGSSARGPQHEAENLLKPEIGAPGASVSAEVGTGTARTPFGGTSGASPMVAGSAALLLEAQPGLTPAEAKAKLMNTGDTNIDIDPFSGLAEITRIGGGEVRADRAVGAPAAAWDEDTLQGGLSFGFVDADKSVQNLHKKVRVRNYSDKAITFSITPTFRFADDEASGAVSVDAPKKVKVRANSDQVFNVKMTINGLNLPGNFMNSGSQGNNPAALTANEFDGYLQLEGSDGSSLHLPWHVLPRQSANVVGRSVLDFDGGVVDNVSLTNNGVGTAQIDAYSLLAVSPNIAEGPAGGQAPTPDLRAVGVNTFPVPAGFCSAEPSFIWAFAINTWERQEHLVPVSHQVFLDVDQDGIDDYLVLNRDFSLNNVNDGRQLSWVVDLGTGSAGAFFFAEHATNTGNTVMLICGEQIGLTGTDMLATNVDMDVVAQDFYYGGPGDIIEGLTITPLGERYFGIPSDIPASGVGTTTVVDFGLFPGNTDELGLMLITNGDRGTGARGGATEATEALLIRAK